MVLSLMFPLCVSSRVAAVHLGGGITVCVILMTSYRPVPRSRTTSTRTSMGSLQGVCTCHHTSCLHLPSQVCPVRSTLTFFGFSGFLLTNSCSRTMRAWARRTRSEVRLFDGRPRYSTTTRLQLVGPLPLDAPPAAICLCTVLRCSLGSG